jgi:hypothetical protein
MARIYKATIYHVDVNDEYKDAKDFLIALENNSDLTLQSCDVFQSKDFEWNDGLIINKYGCRFSEYDKYLT